MIPAYLRSIGTMYLRSVREFITLGPPVIIVPLFVPVFMMVVYPRVFSGVMERLRDGFVIPGLDAHLNYLQYTAPAAMLMAALLASGSAGIGVAVERQLGFYDRMQLSPLGPTPGQIGRRLADGTRIAFFVTVLSILSLINGAPVESWVGLPLAIVLLSALGVAYGGLSFSFCLATGSAEATQAITPLFFPVLFTSTAFVPPALMPSWLVPIALRNPLSSVCDAIRSGFAGTLHWESILRACIGIGLLAVATQLLVVRAQKRVANRS